MVLRLSLACWRSRCHPKAPKRCHLPTPHLPRQHSTQVISRRLCTGVVITITAAGIIIAGIAIMAGTVVITDGTVITTTIAAGFDDRACASVGNVRCF